VKVPVAAPFTVVVEVASSASMPLLMRPAVADPDPCPPAVAKSIKPMALPPANVLAVPPPEARPVPYCCGAIVAVPATLSEPVLEPDPAVSADDPTGLNSPSKALAAEASELPLDDNTPIKPNSLSLMDSAEVPETPLAPLPTSPPYLVSTKPDPPLSKAELNPQGL
jgi:hypothetical protein